MLKFLGTGPMLKRELSCNRAWALRTASLELDARLGGTGCVVKTQVSRSHGGSVEDERAASFQDAVDDGLSEVLDRVFVHPRDQREFEALVRDMMRPPVSLSSPTGHP
jgi:hypothetical protein